MSSDPKNPFAAAAAPKNGKAPSPFQAAASNGSSASGEVPVASPFQTAEPQASPPEPKRPAEAPASPFSLADDTASSSPFEPALIEPTEGFAASEATPPRLESTPQPAPAPVSMPDAPPQSSKDEDHLGEDDRDDPFVVPSSAGPSRIPARRTDFALPSENGQTSPAPTQPQQSHGHPAPVAATPATPAITGETSQLVLRAIFGVARELDRTEILQRARTLPGIRNLQVVGQTEAAAMGSLRESIQRMGFGDRASLTLTTSGGVVDIIEEPGTSLAVLHEGTYPAGVQETLIIVARELSRLS